MRTRTVLSADKIQGLAAITATLLLVSMFLSSTRRAYAQPMPVGGQFLVNTFTSGTQKNPSVAMAPSGNFVVVWQSAQANTGDDVDWSIQAQRFAVDGALSGSQFQVNSYATGAQEYPAVGIDDGGEFVVVWRDRGIQAWYGDIQGQRFAAEGSPLGGQFQVNTQIASGHDDPAISLAADGRFLVAWQNDESWPQVPSIRAQLYGAGGSPLGGEFQVNSGTAGYPDPWYAPFDEGQPSVSAAANGDFVVVWTSPRWLNIEDVQTRVRARRYSASGVPQGDEWTVDSVVDINNYGGYLMHPVVDLDAGASFVVVSTKELEGPYENISMCMAVGCVLRDEIYNQRFPALAATKPNDEFIVVWQSEVSEGGDTDSWSIQGQLFDSEGGIVGSQFQVNSFTPDAQVRSAVGADLHGNFVVVWLSFASDNGDSSGTSIQGQRFCRVADTDFDGVCDSVDACPNDASNSCVIFADGFEAGNTSAWSVP